MGKPPLIIIMDFFLKMEMSGGGEERHSRAE
jgi:hypothetical protein